MDKHEWVALHLGKDQIGIEVGANYMPLARKSAGYNCRVLDIFDAATLRRRAAEDPMPRPTG
jgi:hypothetical protein